MSKQARGQQKTVHIGLIDSSRPKRQPLNNSTSDTFNTFDVDVNFELWCSEAIGGMHWFGHFDTYAEAEAACMRLVNERGYTRTPDDDHTTDADRQRLLDHYAHYNPLVGYVNPTRTRQHPPINPIPSSDD